VVSQGEGRQVIPEPVACPACGGEVGRRDNVSGEVSTAVYCQNAECPAKLAGKIERYMTALNILGVGDNLLEALIRDMGVRDAADLYTLRPREEEMAELVLSGKVRLGAKRSAKVLAEIDRCRELVLSEFLGALGIFGLGRRRVEMIQQNVPGRMDRLEDWLDENKLLELAVEAGVPKIAGRLVRDIQSARPLIDKLLAKGIVLKLADEGRPVARADARIFCITGSLSKPKNHFKALIEGAGDIYSDTFSAKVTHLVAADPGSGSSKLKKASKQGTVILSEAQLVELLTQ
jgi:DNA ligase (NAD+)